MRKWVLGLVAAGMLGGIQTSHAESQKWHLQKWHWQYDFHKDKIYDTPYHWGVLTSRDLQKQESYSIGLQCALPAGRNPQYWLEFSLDSLIAIDKSQEFLLLRFEDQIIQRQVTEHSKTNPKRGYVALNKQDWDMFMDLFSIKNQWKPVVVRHSGVLGSYTVEFLLKDENGVIARLKEACAG